MNLTRTSKYISLLLRHKPEKAGIYLDQHGWADVEELIKGVSRTHMFNMEILEEIVRTDNKQRYSFNEDKTKIRANQGHSMQNQKKKNHPNNYGMEQEKNMLHPLMNKDFFTKTDYMFIYQQMKKLQSKLGKDMENQFYIL